MKAVRSTGDLVTKVRVDDLAESPGIGEEIEVRAASICSSDFMYIGYGLQRILGHEIAGVRADGAPVVVEAMYGCGECETCRQGRYNLCPTHSERAIGVGIDGGMTERYPVPPERMIPLPHGLDVRDASIVEPATVAWHALGLAGTGSNSRVAVVGGGALGLLAVAGARKRGATDIAIEARHSHQKQAAERLGATIGTTALYDVVIEAAGNEQAIAQSIELVAPGGVIVVVGVHMGAVQIPWHSLFMREARLIPSLGYCAHGSRPEMVDVVDMLATDPDIAQTIITHRFPLPEARAAFSAAADRGSGAIRVVLEP